MGSRCAWYGRPRAPEPVQLTEAEGFYENQDPGQADMNLRGQFVTDAAGHIAFRSVKPVAYPIPVTGPVGDLLRAQGRHNLRPAHIHFMINLAGYKTQFSQVYCSDDPNLETDVQFGVTHALIGQVVRRTIEAAPDGAVVGHWYALEHPFTMEPGSDALSRAPISAKAEGERPQRVVLQRRATGTHGVW